MGRRSHPKRLQKVKLQRVEGSGPRKAIAVSPTIAFIIVGILAGAFLLLGRGGESSPPGPKTAAIVDQLSLTQPNPSFVASATDILHEAGYTVHYFPGEQVTVDFYRDLPGGNYDLVVLRVHSGRILDRGGKTDDVILFTGEPYDIAGYDSDQRAGRLGWARYQEGASPLFGILPEFIEDGMRGNFDDTLIVMMGCDGLRSQRMAQAFLDKGARAFVSWSRPVSAAHTDNTTERLLENLLLGGLTTARAVSQTSAEMGSDPLYGAELRFLRDSDG